MVSTVEPGEVDGETSARALRRIKDFLARQPEEKEELEVLPEVGGETLVLPRPALQMFAQILAQLADGHRVALVVLKDELSTQQAADLLGVSRPYLINLLDADKIPHRKVGRHRRVRLDDLLAYKRRDDSVRRQAADELVALTEELDLY